MPSKQHFYALNCIPIFPKFSRLAVLLFRYAQGKAGKYTEYSKETGITKTIGQSTVDSTDPETYWLDTFVEHSIPILTERTRQFAVDRDWLRYHTPRNLLLALTGELGELAELFQFKGDCEDQSKLSVDEKDKMGQEISDVTIYLLRLADECGVSLKDELMRVEPTNPVVEPVETDELS